MLLVVVAVRWCFLRAPGRPIMESEDRYGYLADLLVVSLRVVAPLWWKLAALAVTVE